MILERFRTFVREFKRQQSNFAGLSRSRTFRYFRDVWYAEDDQVISDSVLIEKLREVLSAGEVSKKRNDLTAYFPVAGYDAVVVASFYKSPQKVTRERYFALIGASVEAADNAFRATHEPMTGLLNKTSFDSLVVNEIDNLKSYIEQNKSKNNTIDSSDNKYVVGVISFDLDFFKQVNDSYGHIFGDVTLKCVAMRISDQARSIEIESNGMIRAKVARVGGEEFSVLVSGRLDAQILHSIGERFHAEIRQTPIPNEKEWSELNSRDSLDHIELPTLSERTRTVSVGISDVTDVNLDQSSTVIASALAHCADQALYRAKTGGRDMVRTFSEILEKCGRVLEHHLDTGVVAIDLGETVGVKAGQEFVVYHPDFTGEKPFSLNDGRSTRQLGKYPRYPIGRIVVFNVQADIAFCNPSENGTTVIFPAASHLEAIPLGSLPHLMAGTGAPLVGSDVDLTPIEKIPSLIKKLVEDGTPPVVCVFSLANASTMQNERGAVAVNEAIVNAYNVLADSWPEAKAICQPEPTQVAMILNSKIQHKFEDFESAVKVAEKKCKYPARFQVGVYDPSNPRANVDSGSKLDPSLGLDMARFASIVESDLQVVDFSAEVAKKIMSYNYRRHAYDRLIEDYQRLRDIGVREYTVETFAGHAFIARGDSKQADTCYSNSIEINPSRFTYLVRSLYYYDSEKIEEAYQDLKSSRTYSDALEAPLYVDVRMLLVEYRAYRRGLEGINTDNLLSALEGIENNPDFPQLSEREREAVQSAIARLKA